MSGCFLNKKCWISCLALALVLAGCVSEPGSRTHPVNATEYEQKNIEIARGFLQKGFPGRAIERLEAVLRGNKRSSQTHGMLGVVYQSQGEFALAAKSFRRALALAPSDSAVRNNYGVLLYETGDYPAAFTQFEKVTQDVYYPGRGRAFENLGMAALKLQDKSNAGRFFQRALRLDNNLPRPALELAWLFYEKGQLRQADTFFQTYDRLAGTPQEARGLLLGAQLAGSLGREGDVRGYADQLARYYPESPEYRAYTAFVQERVHD
ncbi:MAG: type IV pilus biogenesis/stability protein PilW [Kistimonas sp.]|nr:type IV pilus biogenesis/stability protein PilW [Kistimonas sp.]